MSEAKKSSLEIYLIASYRPLHSRQLVSLSAYKSLQSSFTLTPLTLPLHNPPSSHCTVYSPCKGMLTLASSTLWNIHIDTLTVEDTKVVLDSCAYVIGNDKIVVDLAEYGQPKALDLINPGKSNFFDLPSGIKKSYFEGRFSTYGKGYVRVKNVVFYLTENSTIAMIDLDRLLKNKSDTEASKEITPKVEGLEDFTVTDNLSHLFTLSKTGTVNKYKLRNLLEKKFESLLINSVALSPKSKPKCELPSGKHQFTAILAIEDYFVCAFSISQESQGTQETEGTPVCLGLFGQKDLTQLSACITHEATIKYPVQVLRTSIFRKIFRLVVAMGVYYYVSVIAIRDHQIYPVLLGHRIYTSYLNNCELTDKYLICTGQGATFSFKLNLK